MSGSEFMESLKRLPRKMPKAWSIRSVPLYVKQWAKSYQPWRTVMAVKAAAMRGEK